MNWNNLESASHLAEILERSHRTPQVIFKHSTRCATSSMAKNRLERASKPVNIDFHLLDLIANRPLSQQVANDLNVWHESPQVLLVVNGKCVYDESHLGIRMDEIEEAANQKN